MRCSYYASKLPYYFTHVSPSVLQVKVWFQNRRTKYKRVQTEDDDSTEQRSSDNETEDGNTSQTESRDVARDDTSCRERDSFSESEYVDVDSPSSNVDQAALEGQVT